MNLEWMREEYNWYPARYIPKRVQEGKQTSCDLPFLPTAGCTRKLSATSAMKRLDHWVLWCFIYLEGQTSNPLLIFHWRTFMTRRLYLLYQLLKAMKRRGSSTSFKIHLTFHFPLSDMNLKTVHIRRYCRESFSGGIGWIFPGRPL